MSYESLDQGHDDFIDFFFFVDFHPIGASVADVSLMTCCHGREIGLELKFLFVLKKTKQSLALGIYL